MNTMKCDNCGKEVEETTTSSCSVGHVDPSELFQNLSLERFKKLCSFDDQFFCPDCMCGDVCCNCAKVLTPEEIEILHNHLK